MQMMGRLMRVLSLSLALVFLCLFFRSCHNSSFSSRCTSLTNLSMKIGSAPSISSRITQLGRSLEVTEWVLMGPKTPRRNASLPRSSDAFISSVLNPKCRAKTPQAVVFPVPLAVHKQDPLLGAVTCLALLVDPT